MRFLVDADVVSEQTKPAPNMSVVNWLLDHDVQLAISPIVLGEILLGIHSLAQGKRRTRLLDWYDFGVARIEVLDFDAATAERWAELVNRLRRNGRMMPIKDSIVAATALTHDVTVVTRNVDDFAHCGVRLFNPFDQ